MAVSIVNYVGNGSLRSFGITFSYLSRNDVQVYLDNVLQATPEHYTFLNDSTIQFVDAPVANSAVKIQRVSDSSGRLVDYQNGAVLTEAELDIDSKQAFYLVQETRESFRELLDEALVRIAAANGVVGVPPDQIIDEMVQLTLDSTLLIELQNRVTDIDDNASSIIQQALNINTEITNRSLADVNLQSQINALAQAVAASSVYVQTSAPVPGVGGIPNPIPANARWYDSDDNNHPYIWDDVGLVWISLLDPRVGQNEADITVLEASMTTAQGDIVTNANALSVLDATVVALNGTVSTISSDVTNLQASMTTAQGDIVANAGAITVLQGRVTATENSITVNASDITALTASLVITDANVLTNTNGLVTANASILANAGAITTLQSRVTATENSITVNASDITALTASLVITDGNVSANASAVTTLQSRVTVTEGDISTNSTNITNLTATVDLKARTFVQTTPPTATATGDIWYDSDDGYRKYRWSGVAWVDIMDTIKTQTFAQTTAPTAKQTGDLWFDTDDGNRLYRWSGSAWVDYQDTNHASASALSLLDARVVVTESGVSSNASSITTLDARVTTAEGDINSAEITILAHTAAISTAEGDIDTLEAKYGVTLNVNGYITGFSQNNDGTSGTFQILADKFYIVDPTAGGQNPIVPFAVVGGQVYLENITIASAGQGATGKRTEISSNSNELEFYGDRGDLTVEKLATIGISTVTADTIVGLFGNTTTGHSNIGVMARSNSNFGLYATSIGDHGAYCISTGTDKAGVNGIGNPAAGAGKGVIGEGYGNGGVGVQGEAGADTGGYGVHGLHRASAGTATTGYGGYFEHEESTAIPLFIKPDSATTTPKAAANVDGSIWVPSDGNSLLGYFNDRWVEMTKPKPVNGSLSGATYDLSGTGSLVIPPEVMKVTIWLYLMSTNGSSRPILQLKDTVVSTSGYDAKVAQIDGAETVAGASGAANAGIFLADTWASGRYWSGEITLHRRVKGSNQWNCAFNAFSSNGASVYVGGGHKTLTGELTDIRITTAGGTNTFSSGQYTAYAERF